MISVPVTLPPQCAWRIGPETAARIVGASETALPAKPLLGLSRTPFRCGTVMVLGTTQRARTRMDGGQRRIELPTFFFVTEAL